MRCVNNLHMSKNLLFAAFKRDSSRKVTKLWERLGFQMVTERERMAMDHKQHGQRVVC